MMLKAIKDRRSVREYKSNPVSDEDILEIIKAGQFAPSAKNNRAIEFIVVKSQITKNKLCEIMGQEFIKKAPVLIIPLANPKKSAAPIQDLSVASENIFLQAASTSLGTVWKNVWPD